MQQKRFSRYELLEAVSAKRKACKINRDPEIAPHVSDIDDFLEEGGPTITKICAMTDKEQDLFEKELERVVPITDSSFERLEKPDLNISEYDKLKKELVDLISKELTNYLEDI